MQTKRTLAAIAAVSAVALSACGGNDEPGAVGDGTGEISYWLWDANQLPGYQACAKAFEQENPDISVDITQLGWDDYWGRLTTGLVAGTAPDVFTDHVSRYPQYVDANVILPLDDFIERDNVDVDIYQPGLAEMWVGQDGNRYGLPKDWDTIAIFYNKKLVADAGITERQMQNLTWNPKDGGTYEDVIARLTVDKKGVRGNDPGFDKDNVEVYGLGLEDAGSGVGQTQWSMYTGSNGWEALNENPWGDHFRYDEDEFQETIKWWRSLITKGYMPPLEVATAGISVADAFGAGTSAMNTNGSWLIGQYFDYEGVDVGLAPTPVGPTGEQASMFNGLADAIYAGSENQEAAWQWVKFLASPACQEIVAREGVVFPAIPKATEIAKKTFADRGIDVSPFTTHVENGTTLLVPITHNAADIDAIMRPAMEEVMGFDKDVTSLDEVNEQLNAYLEQ